MIKWIAFIVIIITGSILGYFYVELKTLEETPSELPLVANTNAVRIVHSFGDGIHRYTGYIKLPHSCYAITTETYKDLKQSNDVVVSITTKNNMTEQQFCSQISTRYQFEAVEDAPESARLILRVDGIVRPTTIIETDWTNPRGTIITK